VRVNIAAFTLRMMQAGQEVDSMKVIVGRPYRRTPVFTEKIRYMVLNPFWNVPRRIAVQDKLPLLRADASVLAATGYEARLAGAEAYAPVTAMDWSALAPGDFMLRQRPGPHNALGHIKFMLPNPYAVYLHDTPDRTLFARSERGFSSGCIRLEAPLRLADWLLGLDGPADAGSDLAARVASGETATIYLRSPVPALLTYFTVFLDGDARIAYRRDIYRRDAPIITALRQLP
jgi:murein L,D-transpeptidase YcbB/YkuD